MTTLRNLTLAGLAALLVGGGAWSWLGATGKPASREAAPVPPASGVPLFSDDFVDDSGYDLAYRYSAPVADRGRLDLDYVFPAGRFRRGVSHVLAGLGRLAKDRVSPAARDQSRAELQIYLGLLHMYEGKFAEASEWFAKAAADNPSIPRETRANLLALRGVAALRRGEVENCVACIGPSSCIFPLDKSAVHLRPEGSTEAVGFFNAYLDERPDDLGVRWLLNVAQMTLGADPVALPSGRGIPPDHFRSAADIGRFENVGPLIGLDTRAPNMLGGSVFDDFTGDGKPDVLVFSGDWDLGGSLYVNKGDGTFEERGESAGLADQKMAVNLAHADFDNDGHLDVLALRGGWESPFRLSLLRNQGSGTFEDVTERAGLAAPIASQTASWADFDRDGWLDVYVGGEYHDRNATPANFGRLYRNRGDGTFEDVAERAGVRNERWAKGVSWGDYDNDGLPDLFVSNMNGENRLYHNGGDGRFTDRAPALGLTQPRNSFSCGFWDYDNDGRLDLFVAGFKASLQDQVADALGQRLGGEPLHLFRNLGPEGFRSVGAESGFNRVLLTMGSNFADVDNDGFLDMYLATGRPPYSMLLPNVFLKNDGGTAFRDMTTSSGTGHLQKGHGVSFADGDGDGDLDLFVEVGGQTPGDKAHNIYFRNPGQGNHWLAVRLVGTRSNRSAFGARVRAEVVGPDGTSRSVHRVIGGGSSFGGNSLTAHLGLGKATSVRTLTVTWPRDGSEQTWHDLAADRTIEITEGQPDCRPLPR